MTTQTLTKITVETKVRGSIDKVWSYWTEPKHIQQWNNAAVEWFTPKAEVDLKPGGKFISRMEARDGSMGFDFWGIYDEVKPNEYLSYTMGDGRKASILFKTEGEFVSISETFDPETENPVEMQKAGWQAILNNFKVYAESTSPNFEQVHFEQFIQASPEKVYQTLIHKDSYPQWTSIFNASSRFEGSWDKGSKMLFLGEDKDGKVGGMVSRIAENIPSCFVSIEHRGMLLNGEEITQGEMVEDWVGSLENYTFQAKDGGTLLLVDLHSTHEMKDYFKDMFPKALLKLKEITEK